MTIVSHSLRKVRKCALASSFDSPQNGLAYTMVISPVLISKFLSLMLTAGPVGTLATAGTENSQSDFWAIVVVAAGTGVSSSVVGGVAEEVEARDPFFLRSASGSGMKLSDKLKPLLHYPVFIHNRRKHARLACKSNGYHTYTLSWIYPTRFFLINAFPGNDARNVCWYFLTSLPRMGV
jgi:hypothetical protein